MVRAGTGPLGLDQRISPQLSRLPTNAAALRMCSEQPLENAARGIHLQAGTGAAYECGFRGNRELLGEQLDSSGNPTRRSNSPRHTSATAISEDVGRGGWLSRSTAAKRTSDSFELPRYGLEASRTRRCPTPPGPSPQGVETGRDGILLHDRPARRSRIAQSDSE